MNSNFLAALHELAAAAAGRVPRDRLFALASEAAQAGAGHDLCTIMIFHQESFEVERVYSSLPEAYQPGGRKPKRDTAWARQVLEQGLPFIGATLEDIRNNFADHKKIIDLRLRSVLNMPIRVNGRTLGTLNLLSRGHLYGRPDQLAISVVAGLLSAQLLLEGKH